MHSVSGGRDHFCFTIIIVIGLPVCGIFGLP